MLAVSWDTVRLFLHVLAAAVWVGGQVTLAALVPVLRRLGTEVPSAAARRFNQVAWPASPGSEPWPSSTSCTTRTPARSAASSPAPDRPPPAGR